MLLKPHEETATWLATNSANANAKARRGTRGFAIVGSLDEDQIEATWLLDYMWLTQLRHDMLVTMVNVGTRWLMYRDIAPVDLGERYQLTVARMASHMLM